MAFKRIALAYCVQLERVISIASARREYFSQAEPRKRFDFLCSSEACRAQGIKVSASNYDKLPQDTRKAAHFSKFPHSTHLPDCEWFVEDDEDALRPGESAEEAGQRRIRDKLDAYVENSIRPSSRKPRRHQRTRTPRNSRRPPPQCAPTLPPRLGRERNGGGAPAISNSSSTPFARPAPNCRRKNSSSWTSTSAASAG